MQRTQTGRGPCRDTRKVEQTFNVGDGTDHRGDFFQYPQDANASHCAQDLTELDNSAAGVEKDFSSLAFNNRHEYVADLRNAFRAIKSLSSQVCSGSVDHSHDSNSCSPKPWRPSVLRLGPLSGIVAMLLALASIAASLGVLIGSQNEHTANWPAEPSIYLAVFTAMANLSMRYACMQGVAIAWWTRAMQGSSISRLHCDWRAGSTLFGALSSGRNMGLLGLAFLASTVVVIDGPLLQRASSVKSATVGYQYPLNITIAQEVPTSYRGGWLNWKGPIYWKDAFNRTAPAASSGGTVPTTVDPMFQDGHRASFWDRWIADAPISSNFVRGCPGTCNTTIRAPALAVTNCRTSLIPLDFDVGNFSYYETQNRGPPLDSDLFIIDFELIPGSSNSDEKIDLITAFGQGYNGGGTLNMTACNLQSAIGDYSVVVGKETVYVDGNPSIVGLANNTRGDLEFNKDLGEFNSTLAGILSMGYKKWVCSVSMFRDSGGSHLLVRSTDSHAAFARWSEDSSTPNYTDPHNDVMRSLNQLMFVTGLQVAEYVDESEFYARADFGASMRAATSGYLEREYNVFHSDYYFFAAAALVEVAFGSPLLMQCNSNSSGRDIAKAAGDVRLRYGVIADKQTLTFGDLESTERPQRGATFEH